MSMRTLGTAAAVPVLLLAAGCGAGTGDAGAPAPGSPSPPEAATSFGDCTAEELAGVRAQSRAEEVTGELAAPAGTASVTLVGEADGPCAHSLVARVGDQVSGVDVRPLRLDAVSAQRVSLADPGDGTGELLRIDSEAHPRGGSQPHLFTMTADGLVTVQLDGRPLLPFVATDGGAAPMTVTCHEGGGVGLLQATTSDPPGVVLAWDVQLTTYDVSGAEAVVTSDRQVRDHAADPVLRDEMPELFDVGVLFPGCAEPWGS